MNVHSCNIVLVQDEFDDWMMHFLKQHCNINVI